MPPLTLDYARAEFDTGLFVARYLQVLAWISIAWMVAGPIFFDRLNIDISCICLFWAASALKRHSSTARTWVLAVTSVALWVGFITLLASALLAIAETPVSQGRWQKVHDPEFWKKLVVPIFSIAVASPPFFVLFSSRASRQFGNKPAKY